MRILLIMAILETWHGKCPLISKKQHEIKTVGIRKLDMSGFQMFQSGQLSNGLVIKWDLKTGRKVWFLNGKKNKICCLNNLL